MSDIKIGDLVTVVRWPHPHGANILGYIFTVTGFTNACRCPYCPEVFTERSAYKDPTHALPLSWLRRIDPLSKPETIEREEVA